MNSITDQQSNQYQGNGLLAGYFQTQTPCYHYHYSNTSLASPDLIIKKIEKGFLLTENAKEYACESLDSLSALIVLILGAKKNE